MNPRKMQQIAKQLGIRQVSIPATEVIIKGEERDIIVTNPSVAKVNMMGQETFQISGHIEEREHTTTAEISEEDIKTVMEQTMVTQETARKAIEEAGGDLAKAILDLKQ